MKKQKETVTQEKFKTMIGGQALIEGILMRGPTRQAIVVRSKDGLVEKVEDLKLGKKKCPVLRWPLIRGVINFFASMYNGVKALMFSADYYPDEDETPVEPSKFDRWVEQHFSDQTAEKIIVWVAVIFGVGFSVALFFLLPMVISEYLLFWIHSAFLLNLCEGVIRICLFLTYLILVSKMKDMRRVFSYHGAEHKTIRCYEAKLPLTVENVRGMTRLHPRCGTSFLFVVMVISILVFSVFSSVVDIRYRIVKIIVKLLLLPIVVAISYEFNRLVGRHDGWLSRILTAPGMWLQNFTTNEPDDSMIEVAIRSLELVLPDKEGEDRW